MMVGIHGSRSASRVLFFAALLSSVAPGCGGGGGDTDAGLDASAGDGGSGDAGRVDGAMSDLGGDVDLGAGHDSGTQDVGTQDGGEEDGGLQDGGPQDEGVADAGDPDLGVPGAVTTYLARIDQRDCLPPTCGGLFLQAVNAQKTVCANGSVATECYVAELDWAASGLLMADQTRALSASGGFLLDGRLTQRHLGDAGVFGVLLVEDAWVSEWGTTVEPPSAAPFHSLVRTPLLCLIDPCFNIRVDMLNTATTFNVSGVALMMSGASGPEIALGMAALDAGTLRATGAVSTDTLPGPGGLGETYHAMQFFLQLPVAPPP